MALPLTALLVLDATAFEMGVIAASSYVAWLVIGLPAGVITQRLPLRRLQVGMDVLRTAAVASMPVAWWLGVLSVGQLVVLSVGQLVVVALVTSFANVLFDVANSTFLPSVVPKEQLQARKLADERHPCRQPARRPLPRRGVRAAPGRCAHAAGHLGVPTWSPPRCCAGFRNARPRPPTGHRCAR